MSQKTLREIEKGQREFHRDYAETVKDVAYPSKRSIERFKKNSRPNKYELEWLFKRLIKITNTESIILDFGCGIGDITCLLAKCLSPKKVYAFDLSQELIDIACRKSAEVGLTSVEHKCSSFADVSYEKDTFDIVFVYNVFHHFPDYIPEALDVIFSLLKENGYMVLAEPILDSKFLKFIKSLLPKTEGYSPDETPLLSKKLLRDIGKKFIILEYRYFSFFTRLLGKVPISMDVLYAADEYLFKWVSLADHFAGELTVFAVKKSQ